MRPKVICLVGPTASGKTGVAVQLARQYNGELVSIDSRQVYRGLDIGTGKEGVLLPNTVSSNQLIVAGYPRLRYIEEVPQWLTDIADPSVRYTVAEFQTACYDVVMDIFSRGKLPILVGGTGLYMSAVTEGYDFSASAAQAKDANNPRHTDASSYVKQPPDWQFLEIAIDLPRSELYERIDARLEARLSAGMVEEARSLVASGLSTERLRQIGLEYRYLADHLEGLLSLEEMTTQLKQAIHQYARRQITWFRHHGNQEWLVSTEIDKAVQRFLTE